MFKFAFSIDGEEEEVAEVKTSPRATTSTINSSAESSKNEFPYKSASLHDLLKQLPPTISYSSLQPDFLPPGEPILRRDLYDARFQVMDEGDAEKQDETDGYVDADTDLIPGTYEGGLKTWEGGLDLVEVLAESSKTAGEIAERIRGKRILEIGCGTAMPSAYLLKQLLQAKTSHAESSSSRPPTTFHLQDYNLSVLHLVTLPNLILATVPSSSLDTESEDLEITPEVIEQFKSSLKEHQVELEFSYGPWEGLAKHFKEDGAEKQDLILTAETIYQETSVQSLLDVLQAASRPVKSSREEKGVASEDPAETLSGLSLSAKWDTEETITLVAAKVLYFGVGGSLYDFLQQVERRGGESEDVKTWEKGVGRKVIRLFWP